jgi:hypothetical protein
LNESYTFLVTMQFKTNSRGTLHAHGNIMQPFLQPGRLERVLADQAHRAQLLDFLDYTTSHHMLDTPAPSETAIEKAPATLMPARYAATALPCKPAFAQCALD